MITFTAKISGAKVVETKFRKMSRRAADARPAWERVAEIIREGIDKNFRSQGRRGGGSWRRLSRPWAQRKRQAKADPRILFGSGLLHASLTRKGHEDHVYKPTRTSLALGTAVPYGRVHRTGSKRQGIPKRDYTRMTSRERDRMRAAVRDHLMADWRRTGAVR